MESLNEDLVDVLELREKQLTEMIKMLQKKRRDVRAAVTRLKAETLKPVPVAEENSGGNNRYSVGCSHSLAGPLDSCPDECY